MNSSIRLRWSAAVALVTVLSLTGCIPTEEDAGAAGAPPSTTSPAPSASATSPAAESGADESDASASDADTSSDGSGGSGSGSGGSTNGGGGSSAAPTTEPTVAPAPPAPSGPTAAVTNQKCTSGKLVITLTANADNSYRKGITSVTLERQNEYNAWIDSAATWLGPETGQGNQWTGNLPGNQQNIGKTLRVTVAGTTGSTTLTLPVTASC